MMRKKLTTSKKTIEAKIADFEVNHFKLLKNLTLTDILLNTSPYLLIVKDTSLASQIVIQSINTIFNSYQRKFILSLHDEEIDFYTDFIKIFGNRIKEHNDEFIEEKFKVINKLTNDFIVSFCDKTGAINWVKLIEWNSGNLDLDTFLAPKT